MENCEDFWWAAFLAFERRSRKEKQKTRKTQVQPTPGSPISEQVKTTESLVAVKAEQSEHSVVEHKDRELSSEEIISQLKGEGIISQLKGDFQV